MKSATMTHFLNLPTREKQLFLARSSHHLTIEIRAALRAEESTRSQKISAINELLHTMTGKLRDLIMDTSKQYPDQIFLDILRETAENKCEAELDRALEFAAGNIELAGAKPGAGAKHGKPDRI